MNPFCIDGVPSLGHFVLVKKDCVTERLGDGGSWRSLPESFPLSFPGAVRAC